MPFSSATSAHLSSEHYPSTFLDRPGKELLFKRVTTSAHTSGEILGQMFSIMAQPHSTRRAQMLLTHGIALCCLNNGRSQPQSGPKVSIDCVQAGDYFSSYGKSKNGSDGRRLRRGNYGP